MTVKKEKHKHSFIRMAAEKLLGAHFEYFRCQCRKEKTTVDGKAVRFRKPKTKQASVA